MTAETMRSLMENIENITESGFREETTWVTPSYWRSFASALAEELSSKVLFTGSGINGFRDMQYSRWASFSLPDDQLSIRIEQSWENKEGIFASPTKPKTILRIEITGDHGRDSVDLGRFAMWRDPKQYAEDIAPSIMSADLHG